LEQLNHPSKRAKATPAKRRMDLTQGIMNTRRKQSLLYNVSIKIAQHNRCYAHNQGVMWNGYAITTSRRKFGTCARFRREAQYADCPYASWE
jgi:hypothetical protein